MRTPETSVKLQACHRPEWSEDPWVLGSGLKGRKIQHQQTAAITNHAHSDYSPLQVNRKWGTWGSYYTMPNAIFYLLNGDSTFTSTEGLEASASSF